MQTGKTCFSDFLSQFSIKKERKMDVFKQKKTEEQARVAIPLYFIVGFVCLFFFLNIDENLAKR